MSGRLRSAVPGLLRGGTTSDQKGPLPVRMDPNVSVSPCGGAGRQVPHGIVSRSSGRPGLGPAAQDPVNRCLADSQLVGDGL